MSPKQIDCFLLKPLTSGEHRYLSLMIQRANDWLVFQIDNVLSVHLDGRCWAVTTTSKINNLVEWFYCNETSLNLVLLVFVKRRSNSSNAFVFFLILKISWRYLFLNHFSIIFLLWFCVNFMFWSLMCLEIGNMLIKCMNSMEKPEIK